MPRKILFVVADYHDQRQYVFDHYFSPRNRAYAAHHGFEYLVSRGDNFRHAKNWCKVRIIQQMIQRRELVTGDSLVLLDADMIIVNGNHPFQTTKSFAYAIENCNAHGTCFFILNINDWVRAMLDRLLDEDLYWRYCDQPPWTFWYEQAAWYTIAGIDPGNHPCLSLPHYGWHGKPGPDVSLTLEELHQHVEVRGAEWGTSLLDDEFDNPGALSLRPYYVNHTRPQDVIIRHFCGGQTWRTDYAFRPLFPSPENPAVSLHPEHEPPPPPPPVLAPAPPAPAPVPPRIQVEGSLSAGGIAISFAQPKSS